MLHFRKAARLHSLLHIHIQFIDNTILQVYRGFSTTCSYVYLTSCKKLHLCHNSLSSRVVTIRLLSLLPSNCYLPNPIPSHIYYKLGIKYKIQDRWFRLLNDRRLHTGNNGIPRPSDNLRKPILRPRTRLAVLRPRHGTPLLSKKHLPPP